MEGQFMKAYTIKEVQERTKVPQGTIRQWERDLEGVFVVPRDERNNRYYTDFEIDIINKIKEMRDKNVSITMIKDLLQKHSETLGTDSEPQPPAVQPTIPQMSQNEAITTLKEVQIALQSFEAFKEQMKLEIRNEIRNEIKNEVTTEVMKQIAATSLIPQQQMETIALALSNSSEDFLKLSSSVSSTSEEVSKLSKRLEEESIRAEEDRKTSFDRDRTLMEGVRLMQEIKEYQELNFFQKIFRKKK
ncbi:hypothetical protein CN514_21165 [Bacillus sp. AFS001701]|uniref:MerR family transcriptional regulator n=1 Tax=Bacillus sp. AFS001701 TaxID=2033480 RepID=UPI000BF63F02|nr:MerR family transcriptional regulator [Bacillus sp. AFS001701]PET45170.1 hypothetical protein CN514_21165 [Bacillus sp. AFS001701]